MSSVLDLLNLRYQGDLQVDISIMQFRIQNEAKERGWDEEIIGGR